MFSSYPPIVWNRQPCSLENARRWVLALTMLGLPTSLTCGAEVLIERGAGRWKYVDTPAVQLKQQDRWRAVDYDDSAWSEGQATLGYGDPDVVTQLSFGTDPQRKEPCALFRHRFGVANRRRFRGFLGRICCDDGAAVFVNGQEVYRCNLPVGTLTCGTRAVKAIGPGVDVERRYHVFSVNGELIAEGDNIVAVSVHQANTTSSDLAMDLELAGLESDDEVDQLQGELKQQSELYEHSLEGAMQISPILQLQLNHD